MKTDLERFVELYRAFGVELRVQKTDDESVQYVAFGYRVEHRDMDVHPSFDGLKGHYTIVAFSREGKYEGQEFME